MIITNKTTGFKFLADDINGNTNVVDNCTTVTLPDVEMLTDTVKGAGIMGELDLATQGLVGSMKPKLEFRAMTPPVADLIAPRAQHFEVRWVKDQYDSSTNTNRVVGCKAFIHGTTNKLSGSKVETNSDEAISVETEAFAYELMIDGVTVIHIDKMNYVCEINGVDYATDIRNAL